MRNDWWLMINERWLMIDDWWLMRDDGKIYCVWKLLLWLEIWLMIRIIIKFITCAWLDLLCMEIIMINDMIDDKIHDKIHDASGTSSELVDLLHVYD